MKKRDIALESAKSFLMIPYRWGGSDPMNGFDCSGLVIEILKTVGLFPENSDNTAHGLSRMYNQTDIMQPGNLVFWDWDNNGVMDHVEMICHVSEEGEIYTIGARGGDSSTTSLERAGIQDAFVKIRPLTSGYKIVVDPFEK